MVTEKYLVHHSMSTQQAMEQGDLGSAFWFPGPGHPADGLTKVKSDLLSFSSFLMAGSGPLETLRLPKGVAFSEDSGYQ